jgi:cation diffusion facilitator CzcD-associated flavoprotein CzcO
MIGIAVNDFPNLLIMFGPNSAAPWANLTTVFETQATYIAKVVRHIKRQNSRSPYAMMPEGGVQRRFNDWIQANMGPLAIISPNCSNYYTVILCLVVF